MIAIFLKLSCNVSKENDCKLLWFIIFTTDCYRFWLHHKGHPLTVLKILIGFYTDFFYFFLDYETLIKRISDSNFLIWRIFNQLGPVVPLYGESKEARFDWLDVKREIGPLRYLLFIYSQVFYQTKIFAKPNSESNYW